MGTKKKKQSVVLLLLLLAVILMTIGFAAYTSTLNINGNVTVKGSPWKVLYNNAYATDGVNTTANTSATTTVTSEAIDTNDTNFAFTVTLSKPGDIYEAEVALHNYGTMTAYLNQVNLGTLTTAQQKYLQYTITYGGTTYSASNQAIDSVSLAAGAEQVATIKVQYLQPADANDLPATDTTVTITGSFVFNDTDANS